MACTHPLGVEPIRDEEGEVIGARCPVCRSVALAGDSYWTRLLQIVRSFAGKP